MLAIYDFPVKIILNCCFFQGGEYPSQNIRTAPTPSNPNTPIGGDSSYGQLGGQFSTETDDQNSDQVHLVDVLFQALVKVWFENNRLEISYLYIYYLG